MARGASAPTPVCVLLGHACCSEAFQGFRAGVWKRNPRDRPGHLPSGPSSAALRFGGLCRLRIPGRRPAPRRVRLRAAPPLPLLRRRSPRLGSAFLHGPPSVPRGGCCGVRLRLAGVDQQTRRFSVSQLRLNFPLPEAGAPFSEARSVASPARPQFLHFAFALGRWFIWRRALQGEMYFLWAQERCAAVTRAAGRVHSPSKAPAPLGDADPRLCLEAHLWMSPVYPAYGSL